ncbi:MAG: alpha/beta hydrolase family esterase [Blastocatellia bacterium]
MKTITLLAVAAFVLLASVAYGQTVPVRPPRYDENQGPPSRELNIQTFTVSYGGVNRSVSFFVPSSYQTGKAVPLVFAFHGTTGNAAVMYAAAKGIPQKAEAEGFIAVFPNGLPLPNGGNGFQWMDEINVPYVGFLIDQLQARFTIDAKRIYLIGFSGGSQLCQRVASDPTQSKRIAAIGTVAGSAGFQPGPGQPFNITDPNATGLAQPMSAFMVQGALDPVNPINGGPNLDGFVQLSFADKINFWTKFINANLTEPVVVAQAPANATATKYSNAQTRLTLIGLVDPLLAHAWPRWDVTTAIWDFFKSVPTR